MIRTVGLAFLFCALMPCDRANAGPHGGMGGMGMGMGMMPRQVDDPSTLSTPSEWETNSDVLCRPLFLRAQRGERGAQDALDACRDEAASRLERRVAAAPTLRLEDVTAIPERYRLPEEEARIAQLLPQMTPTRLLTREERHQAFAAQLSRAHDVRFLRPAMSAAYCAYSEMRSHAKAEHDSSRAAAYASSMKTVALMLQGYGATPLSCRDPMTVEVRRCMNDQARCSTDVLDLVALVPPVYP